MALNADEEVLQDFLLEVGEILEQLSQQLVALEAMPDDTALLNAIFRGFHTIKGSASFLRLPAMIDCCHAAESVFERLRKGERRIETALMDAVLDALDQLQQMYKQVEALQEPELSAPTVIEVLSRYAEPDPDLLSVEENQPEQAAEVSLNELLDVLESSLDERPVEPSTEMSDDEFEALLDQLQAQTAVASVESEPSLKPVVVTTAPIAPPEPIKVPVRKAARDEALLKGNEPAVDEPATKDLATDTDSSIRVDTGLLDDIMNLVGELVLVRNRLVRMGSSSHDETLNQVTAQLDNITAQLQGSVMKTRMQPIRRVFGRFPRLTRDLARTLQKEVQLVVSGEDTDLDKNFVEALSDPLIHLVRNALDHGIELPAARVAAGKAKQGTIRLSAEQQGDTILLMIEDDGAGMDAAVLRQKAVERGLLDPDSADRLTEQECFNLIFEPGFSTCTEVTDVSGRGVGMDVVKTRIARLNGSVQVSSVRGQGTQVSIKLPLTLAIMPTLMVQLDQQSFAIPLTNVDEIFHLDLRRCHQVDGRDVMVIREQTLPILHIKRWLTPRAPYQTEGLAHVVAVSVGHQRVGFVVDHLLGQEEVVVKPLGAMLHGTPGVSGATITGDGGMALILDIPGLLSYYASY